jgi:hypothetical protein
VLSALPDERELGLVIGVFVDLSMIELGGADRLRWFEQRSPLFAQLRIGGELTMLGDPN